MIGTFTASNGRVVEFNTPQKVPYAPEGDPDRAREIYLEQEQAHLDAQFDYEAGWRL